MSRDEIMDKVTEAIRIALGDDKVEIKEAAYLVDELEFGSMEVMEMIGELEESFGCMIPEENMDSFVQVRDIVDYIEKAC